MFCLGYDLAITHRPSPSVQFSCLLTSFLSIRYNKIQSFLHLALHLFFMLLPISPRLASPVVTAYNTCSSHGS